MAIGSSRRRCPNSDVDHGGALKMVNAGVDVETTDPRDSGSSECDGATEMRRRVIGIVRASGWARLERRRTPESGGSTERRWRARDGVGMSDQI